MTTETKEYLFRTMVRKVAAHLEEGDEVGAAELFETQVQRYSFHRSSAISAVRSLLFQEHGTGHEKFMAAFVAGVSIVRGRAA